MTEIARYSVLALSALVLLGGIFGFVKAQSKASLISGVVSSLLLGAAFAASLTNLKEGLMGAFGVALLLDVVFAIRLSKTKKFMPAGLMIIFCATVQALIAGALVSMRDIPG